MVRIWNPSAHLEVIVNGMSNKNTILNQICNELLDLGERSCYKDIVKL